MKKITRFLALITLSILTTVAVAAEPMKIGVVNAPRLLSESPQAKAAQRVLEDEFSPVQAEMVGRDIASHFTGYRTWKRWRNSSPESPLQSVKSERLGLYS